MKAVLPVTNLQAEQKLEFAGDPAMRTWSNSAAATSDLVDAMARALPELCGGDGSEIAISPGLIANVFQIA